MTFRDVPDEGEPDPHALNVERGGLTTAIELLENSSLFLERDADPAVLHLDDVEAVDGCAPDGNRRIRRRVFGCVLDQILDRVQQRGPIAAYPQGACILDAQPNTLLAN